VPAEEPSSTEKPTAVSGDGFVGSESGHYPTEATSGMRQAHHQV
jgi:hypothetical protein